MKTKNIIHLSSLILIFLIITGCFNEKSKNATTESDLRKTPQIPAVSLNTLMQPTNSYAVSSIPAITSINRLQPITFTALGYIAYNTTNVGAISARISGRIEKLYVKYRYQLIKKGQKIMDVYSPELLTAQQNLLFILKNDESNSSLINAAKQKLILLGFQSQQLQQLIRTQKPLFSVSIYSNYSGHIHETLGMKTIEQENLSMNDASTITTQELDIKEGMYIEKGQTIFKIYNPNNMWALLNIYPSNQSFIKVGNKVKMEVEAKPETNFESVINFIEPFFRLGSKTLIVRSNFDNSVLKLPVGSQVKAVIFSSPIQSQWLPNDAILTLGLNKIVFVKSGNGYQAQQIETGVSYNNEFQIIKGISTTDSVAANAQFLMDSESFIRVEKKE
jgi:Cu(I)/Ag(I) efflux system membrane fusion protein